MNNSATDPMAGIPDLGDGRFQLVEKIGAGGMGTVYRAIQKSVGRSVAIKVLAPQQAANASGVARFVREANVISRIAHPNIVSVIDFGRDRAGNLLLVMELLDGEPLRQTIRRCKRLPVSRAIAIASSVLAALRVAHGAGIVHRDLKPENIFMCRVDGADLVKVLDFGVAKLVSTDAGDETTAGSLVGTLRYMAPEQIAGDPPDVRVDLHAIAIVLYEMLTGSLPYDSKERLQLLRAILNDPPIPLLVRAPDLPRELNDVMMRAIAKSPGDRYQTADELRSALAPFAQLHVTAGGDETPFDILVPEVGEDGATRNGRVSGPRPVLDSGSVGSGAGLGGAAVTMGNDTIQGARNELTTGAGLSSDSRRYESPRKSSKFVIASTIVGIVALGSSIGLILGRRRDHTQAPSAMPGTQPVTDTVPVPVAPPIPPTAAPNAPVTASTIILRTSPAGASVLDTATGSVLCTTTPCAVSVLSNQPRRVTLTSGANSMQTLLEPGISPVTIDLQSPAAIANTATGPSNDTPENPSSANTDTPAGHRPRHGSHEHAPAGHNVQMFGNPVQMFGTPR